MIKAVLFDLGGTLIKTIEIPEIYRRILAKYGIDVSVNQIREAHEANEQLSNSFIITQLEIGYKYWYDWNQHVMESLGFGERSEYLGKIIADLWWDYADLELYPDVKTTIQELRKRDIKVGVVTNGFKYDYLVILNKLRLIDFFDIVVGPDSCGYGKPDKQIFLYALDVLGLKPGEVIHVGNEYKYDYVGAENAGITPILIEREQDIDVDVSIISSLNQVLDYV
ncbi:MAG: HAD family hydrolase [Promethearchaeota archaeon]|jgi:putative hydrolase of the HAD superfamily